MAVEREREMEIEDNWFDSLPLDEYTENVKSADPDKIPTEDACPNDYILQELSISCGPTVRFLASHENKSNNYRGSVMFVIRDLFNNEIPQLKFIIGPATKDTRNGEFYHVRPTKSEIFYQEECFTFIRFSFEFELKDYEQKVKYYLNNATLPYYQFFIPSNDQSMNIMSHSCNGFSLGTETSTFKGSLWLDVIRKHSTNYHYHVMIGGGDQIYADNIKNTSKMFSKWLKHKHIHSNDKMTPELEKSFDKFYLNRYIEWFGKGYWIGTSGQTIQSILPVALASIPQINILDDHDIIDGFGSYSDITMRQEIFQSVGQHAYKYYMLFQQHTNIENETKENIDPSYILGYKKGPYIKQYSRSIFARLGKSIAFVGLDCRAERTKHEVLSKETYQLVFQRLQSELDSDIKHLIVLLGVPIMYPRMVFIEKIMETPLIKPILWLARKGVINKGLVNEFDGEVELLDDLNDHWCATHHKRERNQLLNKLISISKQNNVRITILSGDVHLSCVSRIRSKKPIKPENDPSFITNFISSAIVNAPPPDGMVKFLSMRAKKHRFSKTVMEDMIPMFKSEPGTGEKREHEMFMNKRNYSDLIPIKNLTEKDYNERYGNVGGNDKYYLAGPVLKRATVTSESNVKEYEETNADLGYLLEDDGIIATLHIENVSDDYRSNTTDYELVVPSLHSELNK